MKPFTWQHAIIKADLPSTTKHVLLTLSCHVNMAGESCYPSIEQQAAETGLSRRAVMTHLKSAKEKGWLAVKTHGYKGQKWRRQEYVPLVPDSAPDDKKVVNEVHHEGGNPLSPASPKGGNPNSPPFLKGGNPDDKKVVNEVHQDNNSEYKQSSKTKKYIPHADACSACFADIKSAYPKRDGSHRWADAERAWNARLEDGHDADEILEGVKRYATYCDASDITGTKYVQQAATFLGRNKGFLEDWKAEKPKRGAQSIAGQNYTSTPLGGIEWATP